VARDFRLPARNLRPPTARRPRQPTAGRSFGNVAVLAILAILTMLASLRVAPGGSGRSVACAAPSRTALCAGDGRTDASGGGLCDSGWLEGAPQAAKLVDVKRWAERTSDGGRQLSSW
jgi:hypothetical protein